MDHPQPSSPHGTPQTRLTAGPLLNEAGRLAQAGWATQLVRSYNRQQVGASKWRIKEWDYYLVHDDEYGIALTLSDLGFIGLISASLLDFRTNEYITKSQLHPLPLGKFGLPSDSIAGVSEFRNKNVDFRFEVAEGQRRHLVARFGDFKDGLPLEIDVTLSDRPADTMVIATPWQEDPKAFYYNQKIVGFSADGHFTLGNLHHRFAPLGSGASALAGPAFGLLDWGRGVWTHDNTWHWSAAQGLQNGHVFGFNLGYGFGDTSAASENMFFVDGRAHKLGRVDFGVPERNKTAFKLGERYDLLKPWHFTDNEGRLDLTFTPLFDRADWTDVKLVLTDQHQVFGHFDGWVKGEAGETFPVKDLLGFAEVVHNKY